MSKYLDKYLEKKPQKDKSSKKLKSLKPKKFMGAGLRIVDSDISSLPTTRNGTTTAEHGPGAGVDDVFNDQLVDADELPQIANFIDERPHEIKLLEEFRQADKWKTVTTTAPSRVANYSDSDSSLPRSSVAKSKVHSSKNSKSIRSKQRDSDESPPRHQDRHRNAKRNNSDSDISPPRHKNKSKSDRQSGQSHQKRNTRASDSDHSPPRNRRDISPDSDVSPPRHSHKKASNQDPSRSSYSQISSGKKDKRSIDVNNSKSQNYSDSDNSPPRSHHRRNSSNSFSPTRGRSSTQKTKTSSNPRHQQRKNSSDSDMSPPRHGQQQRGYQNSHSISQGSRNRQASVSPPPTHNTNKQTKTLDGKKAGLQTAGALKGELEHIKRLEANRFNEMDDEISGRYAKTKVRDRQTGKERDFQAELEKKMEEDEKANKRKAQYDKWGKGLKQVQEQEERVSSAIHEMSKPLARYKDDEDLDEHLKNQDRDGDPMLAFLTKKKKKTDSGPAKPLYQGPPPPPNRFGILPGYRWDGVDRSSGYEKEWFGRINARKALQDESYKWSVEDL